MAAKTFVSGAVLYAADLNSALDSAGWTSYTPTFTNFTLGNGTISAAYTQIGKAVEVRIKVTLGSTSSMTTAMTVSLPITANAGNTLFMPLGSCIMASTTATPPYWGLALYATSTTATLRYNANSSSVLSSPSSTLPFTWASGHFFMANLTYEAA